MVFLSFHFVAWYGMVWYLYELHIEAFLKFLTPIIGIQNSCNCCVVNLVITFSCCEQYSLILTVIGYFVIYTYLPSTVIGLYLPTEDPYPLCLNATKDTVLVVRIQPQNQDEYIHSMDWLC
jgi:hypothetical protein